MNVPIFSGEGKVHFEERKIPTPGDNQLLIQAKANLLCGSDRNQFYNGSPKCIPGHEGAGVIVEKGKTKKVKVIKSAKLLKVEGIFRKNIAHSQCYYI